jgi:hypothetical protein
MPPETGPALFVVQMGPGTIGIIYRRRDKARKGSKPAGVAGARLPFIHKSRAKREHPQIGKNAHCARKNQSWFLLEMGILAKNDWIIRFYMMGDHSVSCKKPVI